MSIIDFFGNVIKPMKMRGTGCLNPQETGWVNERIAAVRQLDVNIWIVKCGHTFIAFDSGYVDYPSAKQAVEGLGIDCDSVSHVFLTHGDMDHAGGLVSKESLFPNAKVLLHRFEVDMLKGIEKRFRFGPIKLKNPIAYGGEFQSLEDGEVVSVEGCQVEAIHMPGHTPGHSCYLIDDEVLVSGDCMAFNQKGGYCFFPLFNMDTQQNLKHLIKLKERLELRLPAMILSGHSGVYVGEKAFSHIDTPAKGTKRNPFDPTAPEDVFR